MKAPINAVQARELAWLLDHLQETLASFKEGLEECRVLLAPTEPGSTLAMSSIRSEVVKGYITRVGTLVVKGVCPALVRPFYTRHSTDMPSSLSFYD